MHEGLQACYHDECPRHEHCVRWLGRNEVYQESLVQICISMVNPKIAKADCPMYCHDEKVPVAYGFIRLLDQLPRKMGIDFMKWLTEVSNRTYAYEQRNGTRPIPPRQQQQITDYLRSQGWEQPIDFDRYGEDYDW